MANSTQYFDLQTRVAPVSSSSNDILPQTQVLNHTLSIKLDINNYILWKTQIKNVIFANGFEDYIDGLKVCPSKETNIGVLNLEFILWRRFDCIMLSWIYSTLTLEIMGQIVGFQTSHAAWTALEKIFSTSSKARAMQLRLEFQTIRKGSLSMMEYILEIKNISNNLATIGESVSERDQIL